MDNVPGSPPPPCELQSGQITPPLPPPSIEMDNPLDLNPFPHGYQVFDYQAPPPTPTPEPEQDEDPFPSLEEFWQMLEIPRGPTPLPAYYPFEFKPPEYDTPPDEQVHQGFWYCHECHFTVPNSVRSVSSLGMYSQARCARCNHVACRKCMFDNALQPIPWSEARKFKYLEFSKGSPFLVVCSQCGFIWGASDEQGGRRQWAKNLLKKGVVKVIEGMFRTPPGGYKVGPGLMGCGCKGIFANDWACFRVVGDGRFDPNATSMRVLEMVASIRMRHRCGCWKCWRIECQKGSGSP
ncbi:hypothetical protein BU16DRAFT_557778 [Lophium mytilinum]|uniref:Probable double zinc ribbon domain-containing protein n=1 Tax=Lophium mytilinum TaxID=390894 RepID=A0A6A6R3Z3_9PEZI|nr:hypothetical protein BU16DRAFT_557778 [Lophium mytilinum]